MSLKVNLTLNVSNDDGSHFHTTSMDWSGVNKAQLVAMERILVDATSKFVDMGAAAASTSANTPAAAPSAAPAA